MTEMESWIYSLWGLTTPSSTPIAEMEHLKMLLTTHSLMRRACPILWAAQFAIMTATGGPTYSYQDMAERSSITMRERESLGMSPKARDSKQEALKTGRRAL